VKEAGEFVGAHYPRIDFMRLAKGYPKEVGMQTSRRAAGLVDGAGDDDHWQHKPMQNANAPIIGNADDVCSEVFKLTT
jgi:hypothetical protein